MDYTFHSRKVHSTYIFVHMFECISQWSDALALQAGFTTFNTCYGRFLSMLKTDSLIPPSPPFQPVEPHTSNVACLGLMIVWEQRFGVSYQWVENIFNLTKCTLALYVQSGLESIQKSTCVDGPILLYNKIYWGKKHKLYILKDFLFWFMFETV